MFAQGLGGSCANQNFPHVSISQSCALKFDENVPPALWSQGGTACS